MTTTLEEIVIDTGGDPYGSGDKWRFCAKEFESSRGEVSFISENPHERWIVNLADYHATKARLQNKPSWDSHDWPAICQSAMGSWYGVKAVTREDLSGLRAGDDEKLSEGILFADDWRDTLEARPVELQHDPDDVAFKSEEKTMKTVSDAWNGDGLPPVGTICEAAFEFIDDEAVGNDNVIEVMYVDQSTVVGRIIRGAHSHSFSNGFEVGLYKFRPLQSERDKFIAACEHAIESETGEPANSTHIGIIFDAGLGSLPQCKN